MKGASSGLTRKTNAHLQLHCEPVFRDHFKWIEGIGHFTGGPFHGLIRGWDY